MTTLNERLRDQGIKHQIGLLRLSGAISNKLIAHLNRTEDDLIRQMRDRLEKGRSAYRQEVVLRNVQNNLAKAHNQTERIVKAELTDLAAYEVGYQKRSLTGHSTTTPSREKLSKIVTSQPFQGRLLREWVEDLSDSQRRHIRDAIRLGMTEGETTDQMARRIRGTRALNYRDGVGEITRRQAMAMVRTAVNHTASAARSLFAQENQDVIKGEMWIATLDDRTTEICAARDGEVYPVGSGPRPPAHVNCRSLTAFVTIDGPAPEKVTYNEWLRDQPIEDQEEVLGVTKAKLFRDGNLPMDRFVDPKGHVYTLDELAKRESAAFKRAGL